MSNTFFVSGLGVNFIRQEASGEVFLGFNLQGVEIDHASGGLTDSEVDLHAIFPAELVKGLVARLAQLGFYVESLEEGEELPEDALYVRDPSL
jgi:hypothetical protein